MRRKKERYIDRWRREHPRIQFHVSREEYNAIKELARAKNMTMKDLILECVRGAIRNFREEAKKQYKEGWRKGFEYAIQLFIDHPHSFYYEVMKMAEKLKLRRFEPALFTAPCPICRKPIVFTHGSEEWNEKIKPTLLNAFRYWRHAECRRSWITY